MKRTVSFIVDVDGDEAVLVVGVASQMGGHVAARVLVPGEIATLAPFIMVGASTKVPIIIYGEPRE